MLFEKSMDIPEYLYHDPLISDKNGNTMAFYYIK